MLFVRIFGSMYTYGNGNHRHKPEIEHIIQSNKQKLKDSIYSHIIPINRGDVSSNIKADHDK